MTTPPLDLNQNDLDTIRLIADGGSRNDVMTIKNTSVLSLLNRVEAGESARDHWEKVARGALARAEAAERDLAAVTVSRDGWQPRAEAAEKAVAKVRGIHLPEETQREHWRSGPGAVIKWVTVLMCAGCSATYPCPTITALDGEHTKQLGGTPTGEFADVCSCGKSYWPCDSLDGGT